MTRNKTDRNYSSSASTTTHTSFNDDTFANLPDLSKLKDSEKQHILNVLGRDENLRSKHLSRFMQLRKEVNELEQQTQSKSSSACARCHTEFGFLFNTGAMCPKCSERVCKQCRLLYNANDSEWLCQLCCKQMQLLSYSGEWIYNSRSNLRKDSLTASEIVRKSLVPSVSISNLHEISSSDTETEDAIDLSSKRNSSDQPNKPNRTTLNNTIDRMIVPTITDEEKLKSLKRNAQKRSVTVSPTRHISQPPREYISTNTIRAGSSDDLDSLFDQSINYTDRTSSSSAFLNANDKYRDISSSTPKRILSLSKLNNQNDEINNNHIKRRPVDCESVTSSEWGADSERGESIVQQPETSKTHGSKQSLSSRMHLGGSIQSLRDVVNRIQKHHLSASHRSINSQKKPTSDVLDTVSLLKQDEQKSYSELSDTTSLKVPDEQNKSSMYPTWSSG
ncbi:unnamed protein product [Rotaria socialis]